MKLETNKKYLTIALYAFGVIAASTILIFILLDHEKMLGALNKLFSVFSPVITGFFIAFILNPVLNFFEKIVFKKVLTLDKHKKAKRAVSMVCTYLVFIGALTLFGMIIVPALIESLTDLINNLQGYYTKGVALINDVLSRVNISKETLESFTSVGNDIVIEVTEGITKLLPKLGALANSAFSFLKTACIGFAFSIYMLASKEIFRSQFSRVLYTFTSKKTHDRVRRVAQLSYYSFSNYISGYLVDSIIVGIVCYIVMIIFGWPYPALISIIIGVFNMVPIFGPVIGAIPSTLLIFLINPWQALFFVIFIVILQQIDGNFICPRVLGERIGIKPFWVMLAIVVGGSLFGIPGMVLSVPAFAVMYSVARTYLDRKYREKLSKKETK